MGDMSVDHGMMGDMSVDHGVMGHIVNWPWYDGRCQVTMACTYQGESWPSPQGHLQESDYTVGSYNSNSFWQNSDVKCFRNIEGEFSDHESSWQRGGSDNCSVRIPWVNMEGWGFTSTDLCILMWLFCHLTLFWRKIQWWDIYCHDSVNLSD